MVTHHPVKLEVHRHASDDVAHDCGRACAQMVISSLTQGVPTGVGATPVQAAAPVPMKQADLQQREINQIPDVAGHWFTDPDEMLDLLKSAPELQSAGLTNWRLAVRNTFPELMADVAAGLKLGKPAVLNIRPNDHWVVVRSVSIENGLVTFVDMRDPLYPRGAPANLHTYFDSCATDGTTVWETFGLTASQLGGLTVAIGSTPPTTYQGQCLAVVYGPPPERSGIDAMLQEAKKVYARPPRPLVGPGPASTIASELRRVQGVIASDRLRALLEDPIPPFNLRTVRDIDGSDSAYLLASFDRPELRDGLVAVFDVNTHQFGHMHLSTDERLFQSLTMSEGEDLWWTRRRVAEPALPYFPFRYAPIGGAPAYTRLIDSYQYPEPRKS